MHENYIFTIKEIILKKIIIIERKLIQKHRPIFVAQRRMQHSTHLIRLENGSGSSHNRARLKITFDLNRYYRLRSTYESTLSFVPKH